MPVPIPSVAAPWRARATGEYRRSLLRRDRFPFARPARRAGARTPAFAALGFFAALPVTGLALVLAADVVRPG